MSSDSSLALASAHMLTVASATVRGVCIDLYIMWWVIASVSIMFAASGVIMFMDGVVDDDDDDGVFWQ